MNRLAYLLVMIWLAVAALADVYELQDGETIDGSVKWAGRERVTFISTNGVQSYALRELTLPSVVRIIRQNGGIFETNAVGMVAVSGKPGERQRFVTWMWDRPAARVGSGTNLPTNKTEMLAFMEYAASGEMEHEIRETEKANSVSEFMATLREAGFDRSAIERCRCRRDTAVLTVGSAWHGCAYQERLQTAQVLWKVWAALRSPSDVDHARLELQDSMGNVVGGSRAWGGSLIWVSKN